jgi:hypothetical protein
MKKFIITEEEKSRILGMHISRSSKHYLMEEQDSITQIMNLSNELGSPITQEEAEAAESCDIDEITPEPGTKPKAVEVFNQIKEKIKSVKNKGELRKARRELQVAIDTAKKTNTGETNEQAEVALAATAVVMGVTAPLWVWVAIGALVVILLVTVLVKLSSWIPRNSGKGCRRRKKIRVRQNQLKPHHK